MALEFNNVHHSYSRSTPYDWVLSNVSLQIRAGEFVSIVGPSGSGKSTILNIAAGFLSPTKGKVISNGKKILSPGADRSVVFQEDAIFPWMTVKENITYGPISRGLPSSEALEMCNVLLDQVGLRNVTNRWPRELSGGMKKRVDVARAYGSEPNYLLMDEAFSSLDIQSKRNLQLDLSRLSRENKTGVLFITHDVEEAVFLSDRILILTDQPATIKESIQIDWLHPRPIDLIFETDFVKIRRDIESKIGRFS